METRAESLFKQARRTLSAVFLKLQRRPTVPNPKESLSEVAHSEQTTAYFTDIYNNNNWEGKKSRSGVGSDGDFAKNKIEVLRNIIESHQIKSMIDIGCGDFFWMQEVVPLLDSYLGIDIVEDLIADNNAKFGGDNVRFQCIDLAVTENHKKVLSNNFDLVISIDVLGHQLNREIDNTLSFILSELDARFLLVKNRKDSNSSNYLVQEKSRAEGIDISVHPLFQARGPKNLSQTKAMWPDDFYDLYSLS